MAREPSPSRAGQYEWYGQAARAKDLEASVVSRSRRPALAPERAAHFLGTPSAPPAGSDRRPSTSAAFEVPLALPVGHVLVEERLLGARIVEVVVDDLVAERRARHRAFLQRRDRVAQGVREALGVGLVRIARQRLRRL